MNNPFKIFAVEDDPWYGEMIKYHLSMNPDYKITLFENAKGALNKLHEKPHLVCIDYNLPDSNGKDLYDTIKRYDPSIEVIIVSSQEEIRVAIELLKNGVYDYIVKDDNAKEMLWNSILKLREKNRLQDEVSDLKNQLVTKFNFEKTIIGQSKPIKDSLELVKKAINTNINVSISGETGSGKEVFAKAIHYNGHKRKKPFVAINVSAIPKELVESELFGHEKGAFTGAYQRKIGKFEEAAGGTLFLDEIGELDTNIQVKLLRVLQERELVRIGSNKTIKFNVRLITATHKNLADEVSKGNFRKDLFYRIVGLPIRIPPLRERNSDILLLAKHFIRTFCEENNLVIPTISRKASKKLMDYHYPGNVRELKSVVDLACISCLCNEITADDIAFTSVLHENTLTTEEKTLRAYNIEIIGHFLRRYNHNVTVVAKKLGIGKSTIYNMLKANEISLNKLP